MVYGHANGGTSRRRSRRSGATSTRATRRSGRSPASPGSTRPTASATATSTTSRPSAPADGERWSTANICDIVPKLFDALRERFGFGVQLLHDVHHRLTPIEAAQLGKALEPYRLFWLEDATPAENQEAFRLIRPHTTTPLAVGEVFNTIWDCQAADQRAADRLHPHAVVPRRRHHAPARIADFATIWQVKTGSHGATDLSPVTMGAALHFDCWVPNFGIQEYMRHTRGDRRRLSARLPLRGRAHASRRYARPRGRLSTRRWRPNIL